ncbi:unnamed protein product [Prorocentrum cordatum]|uniref:Uncharacterized protein n=1 Tax=Prorocentrum cordatum TaxID=2364126 RepID=A0ABN9WB21_9DINO|nr:unnamed protein product [Polarella glacialis]
MPLCPHSFCCKTTRLLVTANCATRGSDERISCHLEQTQCLGIPTNYGNGAKLPRVERKFKLKLKENYKMERSFRALSGSSSSSAYSWTSNNLDRKWSDAHSEGRTSSSS